MESNCIYYFANCSCLFWGFGSTSCSSDSHTWMLRIIHFHPLREPLANELQWPHIRIWFTVSVFVNAKHCKWPNCSLSGGHINKSWYFLYLHLLMYPTHSMPSIIFFFFLDKRTWGKNITDSPLPPPAQWTSETFICKTVVLPKTRSGQILK